jgi:porin
MACNWATLRLSPNVQYIVHPDQSGVPFRATNVPDALVFGFKFTLDAMKLIRADLFQNQP